MLAAARPGRTPDRTTVPNNSSLQERPMSKLYDKPCSVQTRSDVEFYFSFRQILICLIYSYFAINATRYLVLFLKFPIRWMQYEVCHTFDTAEVQVPYFSDLQYPGTKKVGNQILI